MTVSSQSAFANMINVYLNFQPRLKPKPISSSSISSFRTGFVDVKLGVDVDPLESHHHLRTLEARHGGWNFTGGGSVLAQCHSARRGGTQVRCALSIWPKPCPQAGDINSPKLKTTKSAPQLYRTIRQSHPSNGSSHSARFMPTKPAHCELGRPSKLIL